MKIAYLDTYRERGARGGIGYFTIQLGLSLNARLPGLSVFTAEPEMYPGCRIVQDGSIFRAAGFRRSWKFLKKLVRPEALSADFDLAFCPHPYEPLPRVSSTAKTVLVIHDLLPLRFRLPNANSLQHYLFHRYALGRILRRADLLIAVSESTRRDVEKTYRLDGRTIDVVYQGFDESLLDVPPPSEGPGPGYLLSIGNDGPHKNIPRLLEAFARLRDTLPDARLVLIGPLPESHRERLRRLRLEGAVSFKRGLSREEFRDVFRGARAFVQPSLWEGFGRPPLEAMALSIPVASSTAASLPEVCGEAAVYFHPERVEEMTGALGLVLTDESVRRRCVLEGRRQAEKFRWAGAAERIARLIDERLE